MNYIQQWVDRFFNPERYDYRRTLLEFARELPSELHVDSLLQQISDHLSEILGVDRLAVFMAAEPSGFRLAASRAAPGPRRYWMELRQPHVASAPSGQTSHRPERYAS